VVDVESLVPNEAITKFMDAEVPDAGTGAVTVTKVGQGRSNLTFRVERDGAAWILRRPPMGDLPETAHDMMREHRVLSALHGTAVRVPRPVAACPDPSVIGVPFYLMEEIRGAVIREAEPSEYPHAIVHGDYKLDNVVFSSEPPARLLAILDWEMATLGDPLADVGYLMNFWPEQGDPTIYGLPQPTQQSGYPTKDELLARYEQRTGYAMTDLTFYRTLALWKLAILLEGLYKRFRAGKADSDWFAVLEHVVPAMGRQAREWTGA
jgi:aminoglycoside phosphotransferase (APT) family kinase protein